MIRRDRFLDYVDRFRSVRVLVIGPAVAERDVHCAVSRLAPDWPMPVYRVEHASVHPGAAALTAATIANLGAQATLLAPVGRAEAGTALREALADARVHLIDGCEAPECRTAELFRYLAQGRQLMQIRRGWTPRPFADLAATLERLGGDGETDADGRVFDCACVVAGEPEALTAADLAAIAAWCRARRIPLVFDAAGARINPAAGNADHLIVNERESRQVAAGAGCGGHEDHIDRLRQLCRNVAPNVLLTLGRQGAVIACREEGGGGVEVHPLTVPAHALADRRGLGFVVSGVYAALTAVGAAGRESALLACSAASLAASLPGPKRIDLDDLLRLTYREIESHVADGIEVFSRIRDEHLPVIDRAARLLMEAYNEGKQALVFGNGGSAAEANHLVGELTGRFKENRPGLPSISLSANDSLTTCLANDYGYEDVFARQIETFCREGDVVIGLSTSGRSANVVRAMERARQRGARVIAFTGRDGGAMAELADVAIIVPSESTARIQEAHLFIIHVLCDMLDRRLDSQGRLHPSASEM